jgi:hypothetical protein
MDQLPLDGRITDLRTFARLGEEGVDLFLVDSTNADVPGFTPSEREIMPALNRVISSTKRRVIVASFSSHVHRVQQVIDTAALHNRKVAFIGRSMIRNMKIAQEMGYLTVPSGILFEARELENYDDNVVLICTGSQGEPMAALSRMANGDHRVRGQGCPSCAKYGFDPNKDAYLYFLIQPKWEIYQIGITNVPEVRLNRHSKNGFELLELRGPMDGHSAQELETSLLRYLKSQKADLAPEHIAGKFDGYSESWSIDSYKVNNLKELIDKANEAGF